MLGAWARSIRFDEERPAKNWSELIGRKNEEYQIADKATSAFESTKAGIVSFWSSMTAAQAEEAGATNTVMADAASS